MKTFDQLIITTGFLASASPAMADEKAGSRLWTPEHPFHPFRRSYLAGVGNLWRNTERIREEREYPPPGGRGVRA